MLDYITTRARRQEGLDNAMRKNNAVLAQRNKKYYLERNESRFWGAVVIEGRGGLPQSPCGSAQSCGPIRTSVEIE